jgi:hypothetical protein
VPTPSLDLPTDSLTIRAWTDPVIDLVGHDPRSTYVERFWLGILGPSTTWLLRHLAAQLDATPDGFVLSLAECARSLGLGDKSGRHSPFARAILRTCQFGMARPEGDTELAVRRKVPPLTRRQAEALPEPLRTAHETWLEAELAVPRAQREQRRVRQLALSLLELGEDIETTERTLAAWRFHPAMAREATAWAVGRHERARAAADHPAGAVGTPAAKVRAIRPAPTRRGPDGPTDPDPPRLVS